MLDLACCACAGPGRLVGVSAHAPRAGRLVGVSARKQPILSLWLKMPWEGKVLNIRRVKKLDIHQLLSYNRYWIFCHVLTNSLFMLFLQMKRPALKT